MQEQGVCPICTKIYPLSWLPEHAEKCMLPNNVISTNPFACGAAPIEVEPQPFQSPFLAATNETTITLPRKKPVPEPVILKDKGKEKMNIENEKENEKYEIVNNDMDEDALLAKQLQHELEIEAREDFALNGREEEFALLSEDEKLARQLQKEEEERIKKQEQESKKLPLPDTLTDEEIARNLQAEEEKNLRNSSRNPSSTASSPDVTEPKEKNTTNNSNNKNKSDNDNGKNGDNGMKDKQIIEKSKPGNLRRFLTLGSSGFHWGKAKTTDDNKTTKTQHASSETVFKQLQKKVVDGDLPFSNVNDAIHLAALQLIVKKPLVELEKKKRKKIALDKFYAQYWIRDEGSTLQDRTWYYI